jgi:hypothetical protein
MLFTPKFTLLVTVGDSHPSGELLGTHFYGAVAGIRINKNNIAACFIIQRNERSK